MEETPMSREIISALKAAADDSLGLVAKFVEVCPDDLWTAENGGWPLWLHLSHAVWGNDFFTPGESCPPPEDLTVEQIRLVAPPTRPVAKAAFSAYLEKVKARTSVVLDALTDVDLPKINEKAKNVLKLDWSLARTLTLLSGHPLYHLGYCDAALRNRGLPGVF
jgi:hypothetical protein